MNTLSFLKKEVEANETIILQEDKHLDVYRLLDSNDSYDSLLYNSKRKIILREGEYVLAVPKPSEMIKSVKSDNKSMKSDITKSVRSDNLNDDDEDFYCWR